MLKIALLPIKFLIFSLTIYVTVLVLSYQNMANYSVKRESVPEQFPIVIWNGKEGSESAQVVDFGDLTQPQVTDPFSLKPLMPQGQFKDESGRQISYQVESDNDHHRVQVTTLAKTALIYWEYEVAGGIVHPLSRRTMAFSAAFLGLFPGFFMLWLVGRLFNIFSENKG